MHIICKKRLIFQTVLVSITYWIRGKAGFQILCIEITMHATISNILDATNLSILNTTNPNIPNSFGVRMMAWVKATCSISLC